MNEQLRIGQRWVLVRSCLARFDSIVNSLRIDRAMNFEHPRV